MKSLLLCVFLLVVWTGDFVNASLVYIYTGLSQPATNPYIPQFTAMVLMNDMVIEYYDSVIQKKVPRQQWTDKGLSQDDWERVCQKKQEWFINTIELLMEQLHQKYSDIHILQWRQGCEGEMDDSGLLKVHGINMLNYDGKHIISFDFTTKRWVSNSAAGDMKDLWSGIQIPKEEGVDDPVGECMLWQEEYGRRQREHLKTAPQPKLYVFARKKTKDKTKIILTCQATGFPLKNIVMHIKKDGNVLGPLNGVITSDVLPNGDNTFQRTIKVEILTADMSVFTLEVTQEETNFNNVTVWDHKVLNESGGFEPIYLLFLLLLLLLLLPFVLILKMCLKKPPTTVEEHELDDLNAKTPSAEIPHSNPEPLEYDGNSQRDSGVDFHFGNLSRMESEDDSDRSLSEVLMTMDHEIDYNF